MYFLTGLKAKSPKSSVSRAMLPVKAPRKGSFLSYLLVAAHKPWHFLACYLCLHCHMAVFLIKYWSYNLYTSCIKSKGHEINLFKRCLLMGSNIRKCLTIRLYVKMHIPQIEPTEQGCVGT